MNHIEITHNPFTVETQFIINGHKPADGCKLSSYKETRLQVWIEHLFTELSRLFNGDTDYRLTFQGVESDYLDVVEAANLAIKGGMTIQVEWVPTEPTESRLGKVRQLMDAAQAHPKFNAYIQQNSEVRASFEEAFNRDFDVYVVATMSSGKSTLINAMLGRDLLPAANEATTATIARIADNDGMKGRFSAKRIDKTGQEVDSDSDVTLSKLQQWNRLPDTQIIDIEGDILAIKERESVRLVLTDTPGPNNSQNEEHERTTMGFIQDSQRNPLILYVLNGEQLGTNDDCNLLGLVAEIMRKGGRQSRDRFIFVLNRMDAFDPDREYLPSVLERVRQYLENNGIQNPLIYPVSANLTRLIRKPSDQHTSKERGWYRGMADLFSEEPRMNLLQYMPLTSRVRRALEDRKYSQLMLSSGLPAVETMIDEYIDKYNLPHRLKRAYDAMNRAIEAGLNEAHLIEQLDQDKRTLARINEEIESLQQRREKGFDAAAYKDKIAREGKVLPEAAEQSLVRLEAENKAFFDRVRAELTSVAIKPEKADRSLRDTEEKLRFQFNKLINAYESVFRESQNEISQDLKSEYQRYIKNLFQECQDLNLPILEGIRQSVADISLNLEIRKDDIKTRAVVIGTKEISTSKWYKPWTWGDTETVNVYGDEKYVDLSELWSERETRIYTEFSRLQQSARKRITSGKDILVDQYLTFMNREFDQKFNEILNSLQDKLTDQEARQSAIKEARKSLDWITEFKIKLDATLAV